MTTLSEKILRSREKIIETGGFKFTIRRPSEVQMLEFHKDARSQSLLKHVVGWADVREMDLFDGGEGHPAPFDSEACIEWLSDRSDLMIPVINAIVESYQAHKLKLGDAEKK